MKQDGPEYKDIASMLPSIPEAPFARKQVLLDLAGRMGRGDDSEGNKRKMQIYFTMWLDKLLEAGVDITAVNKEGLDCIDLLDTGAKRPTKMACNMAKRMIDEGFPFVERGSAERIGGKILQTCLAHLAILAKRGSLHCDAEGNNVLHVFAQHRNGLLAWYLSLGEDIITKSKGRLFDSAQNTPRYDGCTPLHILWDHAAQKDFDNDSQAVWNSTHLLVKVLGGDLQARDGAGRSALDIIHDKVSTGLEVAPTPGLDTVVDAIHAKTMAMIMNIRVAETGASVPKLRL